jgi:hypothetical protein
MMWLNHEGQSYTLDTDHDNLRPKFPPKSYFVTLESKKNSIINQCYSVGGTRTLRGMGEKSGGGGGGI